MIDGSNQITWFVKDDGSVIVNTSTIDELFSKLSSNITIEASGKRIISDLSDMLMIQDWKGWTSVKSIVKNKLPDDDKWSTMKISDQSITISDFHIVPTYDPSRCMKGFNGESKYRTICKHVYGLTDTDVLRYRDIDDEFVSPEIKESSSSSEFGYEIHTTSGFYNVNGIHMVSETR